MRSVPDVGALLFSWKVRWRPCHGRCFYYASVGIPPQSGGTVDARRKVVMYLAEINEATTKKRGNNGNGFKKGQSGNPGGRPKRTDAEKEALEAIRKLAPKVPKLLTELIEDAKASAAIRLEAAKMILDRTYGKPDARVQMDAKVQKGDFVLEIKPGDEDAEDQS